MTTPFARRWARILSSAAAAVVLAACATGNGEAGDGATGAANAPATAAAIEKPTDPLTRPLNAQCTNEDGTSTKEFSSLNKAWNMPSEMRADCSVERIPSSNWMEIERLALIDAYGAPNQSLNILYQMCLEPMLGDPAGELDYTTEQREMTAALSLCDTHPDAPTVRERLGLVETEEREQEAQESETSTNPMSRPLDITCRSEDRSTSTFSTITEAWEADIDARYRCDVEDLPRSEWTDFEEQAIDVAGYESGSIGILYGKCAQPLLGDQDGRLPYSDGQRDEVEGALTLCPDHPDAGEVQDRMTEAVRVEQMTEEGRAFYSGTYRIGEDVQAGRYASEAGEEPFEGCYWALLDESGEIIDNNFISSGFRVEISVPSSAYSLTVDRCGQFLPVE